MHKRLKDGTMTDCLYQVLNHEKDYRQNNSEKIFKTIAGN